MLVSLVELSNEYECTRSAMGRNLAYCDTAEVVGKVKYYDPEHVREWLVRNRKTFVDDIEKRRQSRLKKQELKNWRFVPMNVGSYDNLPFHEQRLARNPNGDKFSGVPADRILAIMNTLPRM